MTDFITNIKGIEWGCQTITSYPDRLGNEMSHTYIIAIPRMIELIRGILSIIPSCGSQGKFAYAVRGAVP